MLHDTTEGLQRVLTLYDAYRSQLTINILEFFECNIIILYALTFHMSYKTNIAVFFCIRFILKEDLWEIVRDGERIYTKISLYNGSLLIYAIFSIGVANL